MAIDINVHQVERIDAGGGRTVDGPYYTLSFRSGDGQEVCVFFDPHSDRDRWAIQQLGVAVESLHEKANVARLVITSEEVK